MATVRDNVLIEGLSGMFGRSIVFKSLRGKTIITPRPAPPGRQSEQQRANRSKFREASTWAKEVLQDAAKKEYYIKKAKKLNLPNAYTAAITDYMRSPQVAKSFTEEKGTNYTVGKKGFALKNAEVMTVVNGEKRTRTGVPARGNAEYDFLLSWEEQQHEVYVTVTDGADREYVFRINDFL